MLSKKEIKDIQSLDEKKHRDSQQLFVAEGPKIVLELLQEKRPAVQNIYATADWIDENKSIVTDGFKEVTETELQKISHLKTPNRVLALVRQQPHPEPVVHRVCLYLDSIQDPGNLGSIIRIADWFSIEAIVCSEGCADRYNSKVVQSSMASIVRVPVYYDAGRNWLPRQTVPIYAAALDGQPLQAFPKIKTGVVVIGNESKGISPEIIALAQHRLTIPRRGAAESLNAAVAAGIIVSHLVN